MELARLGRFADEASSVVGAGTISRLETPKVAKEADIPLCTMHM